MDVRAYRQAEEQKRLDEWKQKEKTESLAMMKNPVSWPQMVLPLKKRAENGGMPEMGILLGNKPTIYRVNMWELAGPLSKLEDGPKDEFASYEAIVEAGWVVD